ncbi:unnamed protein product, partial [Didymodactylos carnosus]
AQNLIRLGGGSKRVFEASEAAYLEQKYQWSLELTEAPSLYPEDLNMSEIIQLQVLSLQNLASLQTSTNGRNWYLRKALKIQELSYSHQPYVCDENNNDDLNEYRTRHLEELGDRRSAAQVRCNNSAYQMKQQYDNRIKIRPLKLI